MYYIFEELYLVLKTRFVFESSACHLLPFCLWISHRTSWGLSFFIFRMLWGMLMYLFKDFTNACQYLILNFNQFLFYYKSKTSFLYNFWTVQKGIQWKLEVHLLQMYPVLSPHKSISLFWRNNIKFSGHIIVKVPWQAQIIEVLHKHHITGKLKCS